MEKQVTPTRMSDLIGQLDMEQRSDFLDEVGAVWAPIEGPAFEARIEARDPEALEKVQRVLADLNHVVRAWELSLMVLRDPEAQRQIAETEAALVAGTVEYVDIEDFRRLAG